MQGASAPGFGEEIGAKRIVTLDDEAGEDTLPDDEDDECLVVCRVHDEVVIFSSRPFDPPSPVNPFWAA